MQLAVALVCSSVVIYLASVDARGAGRAFPVDSENYVIDRFQTINSQLEWDTSNYLVDLAGYHANCDAAGSRAREISVDTLTQEGATISGIVDSVEGPRSDVDGVNGYIRSAVDNWINRRTFDNLIRRSGIFGCSVRPGCRGSAVISCLFSSGSGGGQNDGNQNDQSSNLEDIRAKAFTIEQYATAEHFTGNQWDRSHFLENLSGMETKCAMLRENDWPFSTVRRIESEYGLRISPVYGSAPNVGSTQDALDQILSEFKEVRNAKELGCSLIPDCMEQSDMFVVVTCLYSNE